MNQMARLDPPAFARPARRAPAFGARPASAPRLSLIVALDSHLFEPAWWRGVATLLLLCGSAALLAAGFEPLPGGHPAPLGPEQWQQMEAVGIGPAEKGARTGFPMAETVAVEPLTSAPERARVELYATLNAGDSLASLLIRSGASVGDAMIAGRLAAAGHPIEPGTSIAITLGARTESVRPIEQVSLRAGLDTQLAIVRGNAGLEARRTAIAVDATPIHIRGRAGDGLYWALRAAGVSVETAAEYLKALATQVDVGAIASADRFDLVVANRKAATGENVPGELLYAGLEPAAAPPLRLLRWPVGGSAQWLEASGVGRQTSGMTWPVNAPITSSFGMRFHPILHYSRMHNGIDFGARWGSPIVAAADGQVERAGWAGGSGNQVRLGHGAGLETSYSHMSRILVAPGSSVRQGQLIGYVGSTGLSTGPHLHYEVYRGGTPVNPMSIRFISHARLEGGSLEAFKARMKALLSLPAAG